MKISLIFILMQGEEMPSFYTDTASICLGLFFTQNVYIQQL